MTPYLALTKHANQSMGNPIFFGKLRAFFSVLEFFQNLTRIIFGQLGVFVFRSKLNRSMLMFIQGVGQSRVISQIGNNVVGWVAIVMTAFHSFWARPNKCEQYKPMYSKIFGFLVFAKSNLFPSKCSIALTNNLPKEWLGQFSVLRKPHSVKASNFSKVGYFVKALVIGHGFPDFFHVVAPSNAPKCKIHGSQWSDWFSGANLAMKLHYNKTLE